MNSFLKKMWSDKETVALVFGFISTGLTLLNIYIDLAK